MKKAVFIDKDGTLIHDVPYNVNPDLIKLVDDAIPALRLLQQQEYLLIVISNQSGIARGYFTEEALTSVSDTISEMLAKEDISISGFYYCPHYKEGTVEEYSFDCDCRKPKPGLILQAAEDFSVDLSQSWMIGDILNDVEAGKTAGCKAILINNGNETEWVVNSKRQPDHTAKSLLEAANTITQLHEQQQ